MKHHSHKQNSTSSGIQTLDLVIHSQECKLLDHPDISFKVPFKTLADDVSWRKWVKYWK